MEVALSAKGTVTLENFWGEPLKLMKLTHLSLRTSTVELKDVPQGAIIKNAMEFIYQRGIGKPRDYWILDIVTQDNTRYRSEPMYDCSIDETGTPTEGHVIVGVNGESKRIYTVLDSGDRCSDSMNQVWL
ncbi:hypothetical protein GKR56_12660 [Providencia alcalifaciens]|uniref:Uncharacterized protein n=1 Tax=Providencia alcalifaciens DSM 30120 TaxID=520999 RepID=B6XJ08_9GAMM|nr:hypothetical protein [Providencia alcalifaciens]ATG16935.1 hypothetical protein CO695_11760 [Providencia alcalifaciens]EEB44545.1 hypothetical protein PROVALCAL_03357 [Providencia alcalifaciens DSM 30120]MTC25984.1 hypothetical protein [Providencia alcalifaciens]MTC54076.1 hypothetical protein [Providencia alcalifaciens]SPY73564.1 Uncharacterised protein [Providencia alcalifaciens]